MSSMDAAGIGPRPPGDPDAMRALAHRLQAEAGRLSKYESLDLSTWQAKKALEVRADLETYAAQVRMASNELEDAARVLTTAADRVEREQLDWVTRKTLADAKHSHIPRDKI
jgi:hypothetical protein